MRAMKDSGVEWIGEIPQNWETIKAKTILDANDGGVWGDEPTGEGDKVVIRSTEQTVDGKWYIVSPAKRDLSKEKISGRILSGDLLITKSSGSSLHIGKTTIADDYFTDNECYYSNFIQRIRCRDFYSGRFLWYLFNSNIVREQFVYLQNSTSGIGNINAENINNVFLPYPNITVQQKIVDYLDSKCSKIDSIIEKQQAVIEKLKEYKLSVITEAVTKGLNPDVEMKDSGVEWIGEVPKHWEVKRLRYVGLCQNGISKSGEFFGTGYPFVSYSDVYKNIELPKVVSGKLESTEKERELYSVVIGDIFFTRTSETIEEIGFSSVCLSTIADATFAGFLIRVRPFKGIINPNYAKYYFRSQKHREFFVKEMNLVTRASLSQELLKRLPVLIPNLSEQEVISNYLDGICEQIERRIVNKLKMINKLLEYKKSLIYEVVTGKKEV